MKISFVALVIALLSTSAPAAKERTLASGGKIDFSQKSRELQRVEDADALAFYSSIQALEEMANEADKNLEEYRLLGKYLEGRGFKPREKRASPPYMVPARYLVLRRQKNQKVPAANGEPAYTGLAFKFDYSQSYQKPGQGDAGDYPSLDLSGTVFFRCYAKEPDCRFATASIFQSSVTWRIPGESRGAESSAGGVKPKE